MIRYEDMRANGSVVYVDINHFKTTALTATVADQSVYRGDHQLSQPKYLNAELGFMAVLYWCKGLM